MKSRILLLLVTVSFAFQARADFLPVCQRTAAVKTALEQLTQKTCDAIGESDLANIPRVTVAGKGIKAFNADDFTGLKGLEILNIRSNPYTEFPLGLLRDLAHLKTLVIISTSLTTYPEDFLAYNPEIENLHAFRNKVTRIPEAVLRTLEKAHNLKVIDFDRKLGDAEKARLSQIFPTGGPVRLAYH